MHRNSEQPCTWRGGGGTHTPVEIWSTGFAWVSGTGTVSEPRPLQEAQQETTDMSPSRQRERGRSTEHPVRQKHRPCADGVPNCGLFAAHFSSVRRPHDVTHIQNALQNAARFSKAHGHTATTASRDQTAYPSRRSYTGKWWILDSTINMAQSCTPVGREVRHKHTGE